MTRETGSIAEQVRQHIRIQAGRQPSADNAAALVSQALVNTGIDVQDLSLEEWKALIFDAFQTARQPWEPGRESMLAASA